MDINIVDMTLNDISLIEPNFSECFDKFWSIDILKQDFKCENSAYIVAKAGNDVVGFGGIKIVFDEAEIMNIAVRADKRKHGIGSIILRKIIELAITSKCTNIYLEVNENNLPAISLYEKYDFKRIGLRKKYYNNTDDAIIMTRRITNEK